MSGFLDVFVLDFLGVSGTPRELSPHPTEELLPSLLPTWCFKCVKLRVAADAYSYRHQRRLKREFPA